MMNSIGVWVDTHMVLAKVSVWDAAGVKQVRAVIECPETADERTDVSGLTW